MTDNKVTKKAPELIPTSEKIDKIINRIDAGDIRIPAFQRGFIWKQDQILDLLDSIVTNYPIGSVLLWNTQERLKYTRNIAGYSIPDTSIEYPVNYVLDGQQRLSTIYAVFSNKAVQDQLSELYNPDLSLFDIYYDFKIKSFLTKIEVDNDNTESLLFLKNLLNAGYIIEALRMLDQKYHQEAQSLYSKFNNYEIPVVTIKNRDKEEVGIIFERINNTGTKLSTLDLMTAWTWTDDFHLLESSNKLLEELDEKGFGDIPHNILLQIISGIIQDKTTTKEILSLGAETVRDNWDLICESLKKAIDFLSTEIKCSHLDFLPNHQLLIAISKYFSFLERPEDNEIEALKKWFWKISFSNRYSTGQTTKKMNNDIETIKEIKKGNYNIIEDFSYTVTKSDLIKTKFSKGNSITRSFLLLMAQFSPIDLTKGTLIDLGVALSKYNRREFHHIFPNAFLKKQGFEVKEIFSTINFCFLPSDSNKAISRKSPSIYFFDLIPDNKYKKILESNLIPLKKDIYQTNNFREFLEKRAELTINKIDQLTT